MKRIAIVRWLGVSLAASLALGGCTSPSEEISGTSGGGTQGGTLVWAAAGDATTLNPHEWGAQNDRQVIVQIYDSLLRHNLENYSLEPSIVTDWTASEDMTTYTLTIRDDVTFHDGQPMTAEDVKWSLERSAAPEASRTASLLSAVESIEVIDEQTIELQLSSPDSYIPNVLVDVYVSPVDSADYNESPVGTGPFKFVRWDRNSEIALERNDDYWDGDLPYLDEVVIKAVPEDTARVVQLLNEESQLTNAVPFAQVEQLQQGGIVMATPPEEIPAGFYDLRLNTAKAPWDDKLVRQALSYAIDREAISEAMFGFLSPTSNPMFLEEFLNPDAASYEFDPERAKELLAEAGHSGEIDGGTMYVHPDLGAEYGLIAQLIQDQAANVGINIELRNMDVATWVDLVFGQKDFDIGLSSMVPKPDEYDILAHSYAKTTGEATGWQEENPEFFKLLAEARTLQDPEEYRQAIFELQEAAMDGQSVIIIGGRQLGVALSSQVEDFTAHAQGTVFLRDVRIAQ